MEISEQIRTNAWQGWCVARMVGCGKANANQVLPIRPDLHQRRHTALVVAILLCGTGAMAMLIASVPDWLQPVLGFAVAAFSVWIADSSYVVKAAMANSNGIERQERT